MTTPLMKAIRISTLTLALFVLSACSRGSNDDRHTLTGYLVDSPVSGVRYSTATQSGLTGSDGAFLYEAGETVTFSLGDTTLGSSQGKNQLSLFDLFPGATPLIGNNALSEAIYSKEVNPFQKVMNLAVLLQTLDEDGNPDNGIKISAAVAGLFAGVSFNFEQSVETFQRDPAFRSILNQANTQALLSDQRAIKNPRYAIAHLYNTLDINPQLYAAIRFEEDTDADGTTDRIKTYQYDIYGNCTRQEEDSDANGSADYITITQYNDQGKRTRYESDNNADGTADFITTYQYDDQGNETRSEVDFDANGIADYITTTQYDDQGKRTEHTIGYDANGTTNRITTYQYNAQGNLTRVESDADANGTTDLITTYQYNAQGNLTREESDADANGIADYLGTYTYDAQGNLTRYEEVYDANSTTGRIIDTLQYDAQGNLTRVEYDANADGTVDAIKHYTYAPSGWGNLGMRMNPEIHRATRAEEY